MSLAEHLDFNLIGVGAAAVVAHLIGGFWFSDTAFGLPYKKELERLRIMETGSAVSMPTALAGHFAGNLARAYCVAHLTKDVLRLGPGLISNVGAGVHSALVGFLGFILPTRLSNVFWAGQPWNIFWITTGQELVSCLAIGTIIGYLHKK